MFEQQHQAVISSRDKLKCHRDNEKGSDWLQIQTQAQLKAQTLLYLPFNPSQSTQRVREWVWTRLQHSRFTEGHCQSGSFDPVITTDRAGARSWNPSLERASGNGCDGFGFSLSLRYSALFVTYNPALTCRECMQFQILPKLAARWCNKGASFMSGLIPCQQRATIMNINRASFPLNHRILSFICAFRSVKGKHRPSLGVYLRIRDAATATWKQTRLAKMLPQTNKALARKACF